MHHAVHVKVSSARLQGSAPPGELGCRRPREASCPGLQTQRPQGQETGGMALGLVRPSADSTDHAEPILTFAFPQEKHEHSREHSVKGIWDTEHRTGFNAETYRACLKGEDLTDKTWASAQDASDCFSQQIHTQPKYELTSRQERGRGRSCHHHPHRHHHHAQKCLA